MCSASIDRRFQPGRSGAKTGWPDCRMPIGNVTTARRACTRSSCPSLRYVTRTLPGRHSTWVAWLERRTRSPSVSAICVAREE